MFRLLPIFTILLYNFSFSQLTWSETNTGSSATISVGEFQFWNMSNPTLLGQTIPNGSLIGVFYLDGDGQYACAGAETYTGEGMLSVVPWGDDSTTPEKDGFSDGENFNWFLRVCENSECWNDSDGDGIIDDGEVLDGVDYYSSDAQMVEPVSQITGTVYANNALLGLQSANFVEYDEDGDNLVECSCLDGTATIFTEETGFCFIPFGGCSDSSAINYCYTGELNYFFNSENCLFAGAGCTNELAVNYDSSATEDDGSCIVSGCTNELAANYDSSATLDNGSCILLGCTDETASNYDSTATNDDGSCEFGCTDNDNSVAGFGGCSAAVALLGCDFIFVDGTSIAENCPVTCDNCPCIDNDTAVSGFGGCSGAVALLGCDFVFVDGTSVAENCQVTCDNCETEETSCEIENILWENPLTDANMTVQVSANAISLNGGTLPVGALVGAFYTNENNELSCGGYLEYLGDQLAIAVWGDDSSTTDDDGFEAGESITWLIKVGAQTFAADEVIMSTEPPFSDTYVSNGFGQISSATYVCEISEILGCTDESAYNYNSDATIDDGSCYDLDWNVVNTDCNMTILVNTPSDITLNGSDIPTGATIGLFYEDANGQLSIAGSSTWTGTSITVPAWGSESGLDNGFEVGENLSNWALLIGDQTISMDENGATMTSSLSFSQSYVCNGFGELISVNFEGDFELLLGCTDATACNFDINASGDDGSCTFAQTYYQDSDGDGLGNPAESTVSCTDVLGFVTNSDDPCPDNLDNPNNSLVWYFDFDSDGLGDETFISGQIGCDSPGPEWVDNNNDLCPESPLNDSNENGICDVDEILGCTDSNSINFNPDANIDDGSCVTELLGCTNPESLNYNPDATTDDGSCIALVLGCSDENALNYNQNVNSDDGSCCYIGGCSDENSLNYNPFACIDDGSCIAVTLGCTNPSSFNYNSEANTDDGSCVDYIYGCLDESACNYDSTVNTSDGTCEFAQEYYDCNDVCLNDSDSDGICDELEVLGCDDITAFNYDSSATENDGSCIAVSLGCTNESALNYDDTANTDDDSCCFIEGCTDPSAFNFNSDACIDNGSCFEILYGCTDSSSFNYNPSANTDDGSCLAYIYGCTDTLACNYDSTVNTDNGSCNYALEFYDCNNQCINDFDNDLVCDELEISGCTDANAINYSPDATDTEDGVCVFTGCLDATACNFDPSGFFNELVVCDFTSCLGCTDFNADNYDVEATLDDGSCIFSGCTDINACNYSQIATNDDGSCLFFDCNDECGGNTLVDECGVCGGSGPLEGYDCDGNVIELQSPWGNSLVCDPFNNHTVAFTLTEGINLGDFVGLFYTSNEGDLVLSQAVEYVGETFYFTACGDDNTTDEKDGFEVGESFIWQLWPAGGDCAYNINPDYSPNQDSSNLYQVNGISQVISFSGGPLEASVVVSNPLCNAGFGSAEIVVSGGSSPFNIDDLSELSAGSYTTIVTDFNGCSVTLDFEIIEPEVLSASILTTDALCFGDFGSAEVSVLGGTSPYTLDDLSQLTAGLYTTTIIDSNGCTISVDFQIEEPSQLESISTISDYNGYAISCNGADDGFINISTTGGTGDYIYVWSSPTIEEISSQGLGTNTASISNLESGTYYLTTVDSNGCSIETEYIISEPTEIISDISVENPQCFGNPGTVQLNVTGGVPPYISEYSSGEIYSLLPGFYSSSIVDSNGCTVNLDFEIVGPTELEATAIVTNPLCSGDLGSAQISVDGGTSPYQIEIFDDLTPGLYNSTVIDANGCEITLDFEIEEPDEIDVEINVQDVSCFGESDGSVSIEIVGGTGGYNYEIQYENFSEQENLNSLSLDGDGYVNFGAFNNYNLNNSNTSFTAVMDIKIDEYPSDFSVVFGPPMFAGNNNRGFNVRIYNDNKIKAVVGGNSTQVFTESSEIQVDTWYNVSMVVNQSVDEMMLYIDGNLQSTVSISEIGTINNLYDLILGGFYNGNNFDNPFLGNIDNLSIWNIPLSESDISNLVNCPPDLESNGLISFWSFDNNTNPNLAVDEIAINDGNIIGATFDNNTPPQCLQNELLFIEDIDNLSSGEYIITVVDDNGCFEVVNFVVTEPEELSLSFETTPGEYSNCSSGTASVFVEGGSPGYEFLWSNGFSDNEIIGLCAGEYSVTVTDANGCVINGFVTVDNLTPDGWDVTESDNVHQITIPGDALIILDEIPIAVGDYIGVFFNNDGDSLSCGGYVMFTGETVVINAYGGEGFADGEQFKWKLWSNETDQEVDGFAVYDINFPDERYFVSGGESGLIGSVFASFQVVPINENPFTDWDLISTYMSSDENISDILSPQVDNLVIIKDSDGLVYWPELNIDILGLFNNQNAYAIKTFAPNDILIYGDFIQPENINFELSGWNYLSYPRYFSEPVDFALNNALGNIKLLKDDSGNIYWPELGINTIEYMSPGEGYVMKVFDNQFFNFPSNSNISTDLSTALAFNGNARIGLSENIYYTENEKTKDNMVFGFPSDSWLDFDISEGDEIAAKDFNGNIFGTTVLNDDNNTIVVWADDELSSEKDGMYSNEKISFELWKHSSGEKFELDFEWIEGSSYFNVNGISIASSISTRKVHDYEIEMISCYPNPSKGSFKLDFNLNDSSEINISIYNSLGKRISICENDFFESGFHSIHVSKENLGIGIYFVEISSVNDYRQIILNIIE